MSVSSTESIFGLGPTVAPAPGTTSYTATSRTVVGYRYAVARYANDGYVSSSATG